MSRNFAGGPANVGSVERMHSSVCAPETKSRPTPRSASTDSRSVASNESP